MKKRNESVFDRIISLFLRLVIFHKNIFDFLYNVTNHIIIVHTFETIEV